MTEAEWNRLAAMLDHLWPGDFLAADSDAYQLVMHDYPADRVEAAIVALASSSQWRPHPAAILAHPTVSEWSRRRAEWVGRFVWLQEHFGRPAAIAQLDPTGMRSEHYPPEPEPGSTRAQRSTPAQLAERAATYGIELPAQPALTDRAGR